MNSIVIFIKFSLIVYFMPIICFGNDNIQCDSSNRHDTLFGFSKVSNDTLPFLKQTFDSVRVHIENSCGLYIKQDVQKDSSYIWVRKTFEIDVPFNLFWKNTLESICKVYKINLKCFRYCNCMDSFSEYSITLHSNKHEIKLQFNKCGGDEFKIAEVKYNNDSYLIYFQDEVNLKLNRYFRIMRESDKNLNCCNN